MTTYLYVITCKQFCKIGYTKNVESRLRSLQNYNPFLVQLHKKFQVPTGASPLKLERWIQFYLKKFWAGSGEWFKVVPQLAASTVKNTIKSNPLSTPAWHIKKHQMHTWQGANPIWRAKNEGYGIGT